MTRKVSESLLWVALFLLMVSARLQAREYRVEDVPCTRLTNHMNHVSDPGGVLSLEGVIWANETLTRLEDNLGVEVAVVALESIGERAPMDFGDELYRSWKVGKEQLDRGILLLLITNPEHPEVCIVTGNGLGVLLPDLVSRRIKEEVITPLLKKGNTKMALIAGVTAITEWLYAHARNSMPDRDGVFGSWTEELIALIVILFVLIVASILYLRRRATTQVCPSCHWRSYREMPTRVIREATDERNGSAISGWTCSHCGFTDEETFEISKTGNRVTKEGEGAHNTYIDDTPFDSHYYHDYQYHQDLTTKEEATTSDPNGA